MKETRFIVEATGVASAAVASRLATMLPAGASRTENWIGLGCSWKRLIDPAQPGARAPSLLGLKEILSSQRPFKYCLHYSSRSGSSLAEEFAELVGTVPEVGNVHAIQLNGALGGEVSAIRKLAPLAKVVIQVPVYRLSDAEVRFRLDGIGGSGADGVLFDGSGGTGVSSTRGRAERLLRESSTALSAAVEVLGLAGGLTAEDLPTLTIPENVRGFLVDCTSHLYVDNSFSVQRATNWFSAAAHTFDKQVSGVING